jgi:hypothetical protein
MTSNLGSQQMKQGSKVGFDRMASPSKTSDEDRSKRMRADVMTVYNRRKTPGKTSSGPGGNADCGGRSLTVDCVG